MAEKAAISAALAQSPSQATAAAAVRAFWPTMRARQAEDEADLGACVRVRRDRRDAKGSRRRSPSSLNRGRVQAAHGYHAARPLCADSPTATGDAGGVRGGRGPHSRSGGRVMYAGKIARVVQGAVAAGCAPRCAARLGRRGRADQQGEEAPVEEEDGLAEELHQPGTRRRGGGGGGLSHRWWWWRRRRRQR